MKKNLFSKYIEELIRQIRKIFYLRIYRKDTPESTLRFYNQMKYIYCNEFKKRKNYYKSLNFMQVNDPLEKKGFSILDLKVISKDKVFENTINKFRKKFDEINENRINTADPTSRKYLFNYVFEYNNDVKIIAEPFIDIVTKYLGTLPILDTFKMWYSPNNSKILTGSQLVHRDAEDFKQLKIFIPIEEVQIENGPLHVLDKNNSEILYQDLIKKNIVTRRNQKINDEHVKNVIHKFEPITLNMDQCALVDTCNCYHYGSRNSLKNRKMIQLHFTTAFSAKTPIFRSYSTENKFNSEKDKLVYGLHKKTSNHYRNKSIYLTL